MSNERDPEQYPGGLSEEELSEEEATNLPGREAMSILRLSLDGVDNFAMPINEATAVNNYSDQSVAMADADQVVIIEQTDQQ
jgi:hypothetical protein